jgi:hypothetical protein
MGDHEDTVRILELELGLVEQAGDDLAWVRAASGRGPAHPDPRLPLIG